MEKELIYNALERLGDNRNKAAEELGITVRLCAISCINMAKKAMKDLILEEKNPNYGNYFLKGK